MNELEATVVKNAGSHYLLSALPSWEVFPAVLRGIQSLSPNDIGRQIANTHTLFAIFAVLVDSSQPRSVVGFGPSGDASASGGITLRTTGFTVSVRFLGEDLGKSTYLK